MAVSRTYRDIKKLLDEGKAAEVEKYSVAGTEVMVVAILNFSGQRKLVDAFYKTVKHGAEHDGEVFSIHPRWQNMVDYYRKAKAV